MNNRPCLFIFRRMTSKFHFCQILFVQIAQQVYITTLHNIIMSTEHPFVKFQGASSFDGGWRGRKFRPMSNFVRAAKNSYD